MSINGNLGMLAATPLSNTRVGRSSGAGEGSGSWFEALARSWGQTLDNQASRIETMSNSLGNMGTDSPADVTKLTAESLRMSFLSQSSSSSIDSVGKALETMARKG